MKQERWEDRFVKIQRGFKDNDVYDDFTCRYMYRQTTEHTIKKSLHVVPHLNDLVFRM